VISPWAHEEVTEKIKTTSFVSVLIDASDNGHVKLLPILIRYVLVDIDADKSENDGCVQIKTKLVDFVEITGETAQILSQSAVQAIRKLGLENKVIVLSGNNKHQFWRTKTERNKQCFLQNKRRSKQSCDWLRVCSTYDLQFCTFFC
jgi:hypothetical protein